MNPFNLPGPDFLGLYLLVVTVAVLAGLFVRWSLRRPVDEPPPAALDLSPYEIAYLSGGERLAIDAAIVRLVQRGVLEMDTSAGGIKKSADVLAADTPPFEEAVFSACSANGADLGRVRQAVSPVATRLGETLRENGLVLSMDQRLFIGFLSAVPLLLAAVFGLIKIMVGLSRHRPVEFLVVLVIVTVIGAVVLMVWRTWRSRRGDLALQQFQHENAALGYSASRRAKELNDSDLVMALGLFGLGVLAGGPLSAMQTALHPPPKAGKGGGGWGSSGWSSCGSSCSGGSSCGGGGGCGGGGCGGCGGG